MIITLPRARTAFRLICVVAFGLVAAATAAGAQETFKTPAAAATALVEAARGTDEKRLRAILGIVGRDTLHSGDGIADAADRTRFLAAYDSRHMVREEGDKATLLVGQDEFPFPIPIVRKGEGWRFDGMAGREEILARRIGRNELFAIQASLAFFDAQQEYAAKDRTGQGPGVYAQKIVSGAGAKDGLYWDSAAGLEPSPLGKLAAEAAAEGYRAGEMRRPFHGYYYKILKRQGPSAPGGAVCRRGEDDRRLRAPGLSRGVRKVRGQEFHAQSRRNRLPEGSRPRHRPHRGAHAKLQPGYGLGKGRAREAIARRRPGRDGPVISMIERVPIPSGMRGYKLEWLRFDITAGLAVAAVAIPTAIAYPAIAGLPVESGLYASILPLVGYALFGPSRKLVIGPDAATMTVLAAALASLPLGDAAERVGAAAALALIVGVMCIVAGRLGLGVVASFLSRPILIGFICGISISILVGQIGRLTGVRIESDGLVQPLVEIVRKAALIHWPSVIFGGAMFGLLILLARLRSPVPGPLVVVVLAGLASALFDLEGSGMSVIGSLPSAMPELALPDISGLPLRDLMLGAGAIWLVGVSSGLVAARSFGAQDRFEVDADRELTGLGAGNILSGLFSGFPVTVTDSRTAMNISTGGRSQVSGLVAAFALTTLLLYLNDALRLLPIPALGAILAFASLKLIDVGGLREIWRVSRMEFAFALISMWGAISLGVLSGVVIAIAGTLLHVLLKEMRPRDAVLGRIPGRSGFYKLHRFENAEPLPGMVLFMIQGSILFFNADHVRRRFETVAGEAQPGTAWLVLDASAVAQIDTTAAAMLRQLRTELAETGVTLVLAELHKEPWEILQRAGFFVGPDATIAFDDLEDAVRVLSERRS